ncbi:MAG TPA: hypothetical protein VKO20_07920 [Desulfosalsimonadaceae bacterium]|nr:hypothetical protein [Desulfosalsimonadaceae bacterium]
MKVLDNFEPRMNNAELRKALCLSADSGEWERVQALAERILPLVKPKCVYKACYIEQKNDAAVILEGVCFQSRVLRKNLEAAEKAFPFVVTIGDALEEEAKAQKDYLEQYYMDIIANVVLQGVIKDLRTHLQNQHKLKKLSYMSVGSLEDWPIQQQRQLFSLLGDVYHAIGVQLAPSMLMHPSKSESGMFFPSEVTFLNCQLCPRKDCPSRKAAFDREMAREYGVLDNN